MHFSKEIANWLPGSLREQYIKACERATPTDFGLAFDLQVAAVGWADLMDPYPIYLTLALELRSRPQHYINLITACAVDAATPG
jgi:hypothetical protein